MLLYFPSLLTQALLLTPSCSFLHHDPMLSGKGSRYETFPYCTLQLGYSQPHNLDHAMNVVPQPHPASGSCREGSTRNLPKVFVIPFFPQPHRNPVQRLSHPFSLPLPPKYSLKPPRRLLSGRGVPCWVCSSPPFIFFLLVLKHQLIMESNRAEDTKSQKHLAEATK